MKKAEIPSLDSVRPEGAPPLVFGHRGVSADAPENTLAAFTLIAQNGIAAVELDAHRCGSGEVVVSHDPDLNRTGSRDLLIRKTRLEKLRSIDVGSWFGAEFSAERLPLLSEVFQLLGDSVVYDVEIKSSVFEHRSRKSDGVENAVARLVYETGLEHRCLISSFDPLLLRQFSRVAPRIQTALITSNAPEMPWLLRGERTRLMFKSPIRKPDYRSVSAGYIKRVHDLGQQVITWTVDDPDSAKTLADMGVDGIISNRPGVIRDALR